MNHAVTEYQKGQLEVIRTIENQIENDTVSFSIVLPTENYDTDPRMALTSVHFPKPELITYVTSQLQEPLKKIAPEHYYYSPESLHLTIKNVRTTAEPRGYTPEEIEQTNHVFSQVLTHHKPFKAYFFRLLQFKLNLALVGTTDPELDSIILDLDKELDAAGVPDNKVYANKDHFFAMMTLLRFVDEPTSTFQDKINELSSTISFPPYTIDTISLVTANAVMKKRTVIGEWKLG